MAEAGQFAFQGAPQFQPEQKKHAFGHKGQMSPEIVEISNETKDIGRKLRALEERYSNLQTKSQITEQNMISRHKQVATDIKTINSDMIELKKEINDIKDKILLIIKEIQGFSKKEDVNVLERYINFWDPLKFVTRNEVKEIISEILKEKN